MLKMKTDNPYLAAHSYLQKVVENSCQINVLLTKKNQQHNNHWTLFVMSFNYNHISFLENKILHAFFLH